ncbi:LysR family transcriptional regulator [Alphaproteobacteria bacterium]|nr:LysR family transcriptional regulator [Alphaproteobacteria bacterium]
MIYTLKNVTDKNFIKIKIQIGSKFYLGPGKVLLLESILVKGSITAAAKELGMSYRKAWNLIKEINEASYTKIVNTSTGGKGTGGATISKNGVAFIKSFRKIEKKVLLEFNKEKKELDKIFVNK